MKLVCSPQVLAIVSGSLTPLKLVMVCQLGDFSSFLYLVALFHALDLFLSYILNQCFFFQALLTKVVFEVSFEINCKIIKWT